MSFGVDSEVLAGNQRVNGIGWLCWNRPCRGMKLLYVKGDQLQTREGPGLSGPRGSATFHAGPFPRESHLPDAGRRPRPDRAQICIEYEKQTCRPKSELTFKLIGLSHYLESDPPGPATRREVGHSPADPRRAGTTDCGCRLRRDPSTGRLQHGGQNPRNAENRSTVSGCEPRCT